MCSAVREFRQGRGANSGGIHSGIQERLPSEGHYFKGICPGGRWGRMHLCRERSAYKETRVSIEAWHVQGTAENWDREGVECVERERRARPQRPLCLILRILHFFLMVMENHWRTHNASIGIFRTNNQCTHKYIIPMTNQSQFPVYDESLKGF